MKKPLIRLPVTRKQAKHILWDVFVPMEVCVAVIALINAGFIHG